MANNFADFSTSLIATAPSPATTGTSLVVTATEGTVFPAVPFYATLYPDSSYPTFDNAEIVLVTVVSTDTLTITRGQKGTTGKTVIVGWRISAGIYAAELSDPVRVEVTKASHGFVAGNVLKSSGTDGEYNKATADTAANAEVVGVVSEVLNTDNYTITTAGHISGAAAVPTETAGTVLFLDPVTAGALTTTEPTTDGQISKPVAVVTASNSTMQVVQFRGVEVTNPGGADPPIGTIVDYAGTTSPTGWLLCYGQALDASVSTQYQDLFDVIGNTYGGADNTDFVVPDLRGRIIAGQDDMGGASANRLTSPINGDTLGASGGSEDHTLTTAEMPVHTHTQNAHSHVLGGAGHFVYGGASGGLSGASGFRTALSALSSNDATATNQNTGSGNAHDNVQPTLILNKIIRF